LLFTLCQFISQTCSIKSLQRGSVMTGARKGAVAYLEEEVEELFSAFPVVGSPSFVGHIVAGKKIGFQFRMSRSGRRISVGTFRIPGGVILELYLVGPFVSKYTGVHYFRFDPCF